jgi:hypothetical protein
MNPIRKTVILPGLASLRVKRVTSPVSGRAVVPAQVKQEGPSMIAKAIITHVVWRGGRPRFEPGPRLRKLGFRGRDLKHPNGTWFTYEEAAAESAAISSQAHSRGAMTKPALRRAPLATPALGITLGELCEAVFSLPHFKGRDVVDGRKLRKGLSPKTVEGYRKSKRAVEQACVRLEQRAMAAGRKSLGSLWMLPAALLEATLAQLLVDEVERHSGLHQARAVRAFLSMTWTRLGKAHPGIQRSLWAELEKMPVPDGRVRPWSLAEFTVMVNVADNLKTISNGTHPNRPEMADSFALGALTATRQTDRLQWTWAADTGSHIVARQSKRGKLVYILKLPFLMQRLEAARQRRAGHTVQFPHLVIDEKINRPWHPSGDHYRHTFAVIRAEAAKLLPSCAEITDQDLRDAAQTWLDQAGVDRKVIAKLAGHSPESAAKLQKRSYIAEDRHRMDEGMLALGKMLEGKL